MGTEKKVEKPSVVCIHGEYKTRCEKCAQERADDAGDLSVLPVPAEELWRKPSSATQRTLAAMGSTLTQAIARRGAELDEISIGCERLEALASRCKVGIDRTKKMFPGAFDEGRLPVTGDDAEFLGMFAAAVREHLGGAK